MRTLKCFVAIIATFTSLMTTAQTTYKYNKPAGADNFYHTYSARESQVSFLNQYKMKVAGTLFIPNSLKEGDKYPAIIVGHPMGAVKEQSALLYAQNIRLR